MLNLNKQAVALQMARKGLNGIELSKIMGNTPQATHRILRSTNIRPDTAGKLATALGVDVSEIVTL